MQKLQKGIYAAIVATEASHVFCCVLPTVFSVLSLLAGLGMVSVMPGWMVDLHAFLHGWELPMITASGVVLALGWGLDWYSKKIDCHDHGCGHGPCGTKKNRAHTVLIVATVLFFVNITVYGVFHRGMGISPSMDHGAVVEGAHQDH